MLVLILLLTLLLAAGLAPAWLAYERIADSRDAWRFGKRDLAYSAMPFELVSLSPLSRPNGELDLGAWYGHQTVRHRRTFSPGEIILRFRLEDDAYLCLLVDEGSGDELALRLSSHAAFPNAVLRVDAEGRFTHQTRLDGFPGVLTAGRHTLRLVAEEDTFQVLLNDGAVGRVERRGEDAVRMGFRGSEQGAYVQWLAGVDSGGERRIHAPFHLKYTLIPAALRIWAILIGVLMAPLGVAMWHRTMAPVAARIILGLTFFACCGVLVFTPYFCVIGAQWRWNQSLAPPPEGEYAVYERRRDMVQESIDEKVDIPKPPDVIRILFVGGSQTYGVGVNHLDHRFVTRTMALLNRESTGPIECINAGVPGARSWELFPTYRDRWIAYEPDLAVLNLSFNDADGVHGLEEMLEAVIALNAAQGVKTVLMKEPTSMQYVDAPLPGHAVIDQVGKRRQVPVIDLAEYLAEREDTGFLWWDAVHLTSYGHSVVAEAIAPKLLSLLHPGGAGVAYRSIQ